MATGMTFADALTGSVLAAKESAPMLLASHTFTPPSVKNIILTKNIKDFTILGGNSSVPNQRFLILTGQLPEPVERKPSLEGKVIVLDAGHGGADPGAVKNGYKEVHLNNAFTLKLASYLTKMGAKVVYTRDPNKNIFVGLSDRAKIANEAKADLFISIHHDSNISPQPRGLSLHYSSYRPAIETKDVYVLSGGDNYPFVSEDTERKVFIVKSGYATKALSYNGPNIAYDPTPSQAAVKSKSLAEDLAKSLVYPGIGISQIYSKTGVKDHNLFVTRWTAMPSVLVELGFMSNPDEIKLLANSSIQEKRAQAMAQAINDFYSK
nr:N-acetylmuramoyl-L-alanine amidase [Bacillus sp. J33]